MSAMLLLLWTLVLATDACNNRYVSSLMSPLGNESSSIDSQVDFQFQRRNHTIIVEEVDKNGKSEVKVLELPDYDVSSEGEEGKIRRNRDREVVGGGPDERKEAGGQAAKDGYGCGNGRDENRRRKCLLRRRKFLTKRYKNWKELIRRAIKNLDREIKNLRDDCMGEYKKEKANGTSGIPVRGIRRRKKP